ncbi:anti-sigma regulatory factor (Ser/Thr protein kinase) [Streptomyces sp. BK208]|uniref:ATP-binding protein n=1 Tax=Streptomyces sp. BK208 TaxID=2512150 RepID=UPI00105DFC90|nr:ATP-binding protein [Streptomyces sp. BK208]TDT39669.1 anti-sigma regulatory factor (Ser/Thr protein kinase) [Streptomyces sp. BK208]
MSQPLMKQAEGQGPDNPLRRHLAWSGSPPPAARARAEADALLSALRHTHQGPVPPRIADDVRLVVSELVTNAARHAPGPGRLDLQVADHGRTVRITVRDTSSAMPQPRPVDPRRPGGHGLEIVRALSRRLTVQRTDEGKQITAELTLHQRRTSPRPERVQVDRTPDGTSG